MMSASQINILIVDDHEIFRRGLKQILEDSEDLKVVAEASDGREALGILGRQQCNVVLLDISMPNLNGIEVLKWIRENIPSLPVLILSNYPVNQYALRLIKSGASGYLTKEIAPQEVVKAIRDVIQGRKYISPSVAELLAREYSIKNGKSLHHLLSDREFEIFIRLASAETITEIAGKLSLSVKTVSTYRTRILEKMQMKSNSELMRYAINNELIK